MNYCSTIPISCTINLYFMPYYTFSFYDFGKAVQSMMAEEDTSDEEPSSSGGGLPRSMGGSRWEHVPERPTLHRVLGYWSGRRSRGCKTGTVPRTTEGPDPSQVRGAILKQRNGRGPSGSQTAGGSFFRLSLRGTAALVAAGLVTVHPNPGPGYRVRGRGRGQEHRENRRIRRRAGRVERARRDRVRGRIGGRRE